MSGRRIELLQDTVAMSPAVADKLISRGNGDAALLYLYLIRHDGYCEPEETLKKLHWTQLQLDEAFVHLQELGLCTQPNPPALQEETPTRDNAPNYTDAEIALEVQQQADFKALLDDTERQLGRKLAANDLRVLLELYDHAELPAEVLMMLVTWLTQEKNRQHQGRKPTMSAIRAAAYRWKKSGVDTVETVEAYLQKLDYYRTQEGRLLETVGIVGRQASSTEKTFLREWMERSYAPELVALAYDRTLTNVGSMKWPYCNAILSRWYDSGFRTVADVEAGERRRKKQPPAGKVAMAPAPQSPITPEQDAEQQRQAEENARRLQAFLQRQKQQDTQEGG